MSVVTGVDARRGGWVAVTLRDRRFDGVCRYSSLAAVAPGPAVTGIDMPLGFASAWRRCDGLARALLGPRRSSVFAIPPRPVWSCPSYQEANRLCRQITGQGLSAQAWGLRARLLDADEHRARLSLFEVHPELAFAAMAAGPLPVSKHVLAGLEIAIRY